MSAQSRGENKVLLMPALVVGLVLIFVAAAFGQCPDIGDARTAMEKAGNPLKNRVTVPIRAIVPAITLESMVAPGDDTHRFSNNQAATVTGYVAVVKPGGLESCECHDPKLLDTHIALVTDPRDYGNSAKYVIVEVTWHFRDVLGSTAELKRRFLHRKVKVTGWLFADKMHAQNAVNTNPTGKHNWRATIFEIHPVEKIELAD